LASRVRSFSDRLDDDSAEVRLGSPARDARTRSARRRINVELPCLDEWTRTVLWNVAYQRAMM
jgi:hypothetical protein